MSLFKLLKKIKKRTYFTTPSHSQKSPFLKEFDSWFKYDFSELDGLDNLQNPKGAIRRAQSRISKIYKSKESYILLNGSTSGIIAIMLAILNEGDRVLIGRNAHKSVLNGLTLTSAIPDWLIQNYNEKFGIYGEISPENIENALKMNNYKALIITSPTYEGIISNVEEISRICKQYGVYLIVDEAHGGLMNFSDKLGTPAIQLGADFSVNSLHKNAGAPNSIALFHIGQSTDFEPEKFQNALNLIQTTSPSYPMIAIAEETVLNLDSKFGRKIIEKLIKNIEKIEKKLKKYGVEFLSHTNRDFTKIVVKKEGINSKTLAKIINEKFNIEDEIEEENSILYLTGIGTDNKKLSKLANALKSAKIDTQETENEFEIEPTPIVKISPKNSFKLETTFVKKENALHRISGATILPYPPGRAILAKGELIQEWHLKYLEDYVEVIENE